VRAWISCACITCSKKKPDIWRTEIKNEMEGDIETEIDKSIKKSDTSVSGERGRRRRQEKV